MNNNCLPALFFQKFEREKLLIKFHWPKLLMTKEAMIGEHDLKSLLAVHSKSIDW